MPDSKFFSVKTPSAQSSTGKSHGAHRVLLGLPFSVRFHRFAQATAQDDVYKRQDEVTSDKFKEQTERFIDRFGEEAKGLFNEMRDWVKNIDTDAVSYTHLGYTLKSLSAHFG